MMPAEPCPDIPEAIVTDPDCPEIADPEEMTTEPLFIAESPETTEAEPLDCPALLPLESKALPPIVDTDEPPAMFIEPASPVDVCPA
jgi:hypothetical protein